MQGGPPLRRDRRPRALVEPDSPSAEPFRTLRLTLETRLAQRNLRGIVFTSPRRDDGTSTVAANFASVTAFVQRPVLLIDADLRSPSLHEMFDRPRVPGLVDVLRDRQDPWDVAHTFPSLGGLHVLTAGSPMSRPGDAVASPAMGALLQQVYAECELVVIDAPPALAAADAGGIAAHPQTGIVVVVKESARRQQVVRALDTLTLPDADILGIVLNRAGAPAVSAA